MQKVLRKRIWRDLKANLFRYLALGFLIVLGMYLVISIVGAADTLILGVERKAEEMHLEEGEFQVFVPLTEKEENNLTDRGISLERQFYLDFTEEDGSTVRVFQTREEINLIALDEGKQAEQSGEIVMEKRYCAKQGLALGGIMDIGGSSYKIVGIGSVPDYDAPYKNQSDSSVDSEQFGMAFVKAEDYDRLKKSGKSAKSEEYVYAYRLNGRMAEDDFREELKELPVSAEDIEDSYFQEYWEDTGAKKEELEDGVKELKEGSGELAEGLHELNRHSGDLSEGAEDVFDAFLKEADSSLRQYGLTEETLTENNFEDILQKQMQETDSALLQMNLNAALKKLQALKEYKDGIKEYTKGVDRSAEGSEELAEGIGELEEGTDDLMEKYFDVEMGNLIQFVTAEDNPRIKASADDQVINKMGGLIAGIIVMILFTYVISVFVIHGIEKESTVIGALYSLGAKRKDLLLHYLMLPVIVTFVAGVIGTVLGFSSWGIDVQTRDCYEYFSIPHMPVLYQGYLIIYGIVMPPVIAAAVNCLAIRKRLSRPALELMRNEPKNGRIRDVNLGNMGFVRRFRIRQMLREARTGLTVIFGMFISLLILMLGVNCYVLCEHISVESKEDTKYEYMYTYKYPEESVPEGGEACFAKTLKKEVLGYNLDITLLGINSSNPYFDASVKKGMDQVILSSAMAQKYGLSVGDKVILEDQEEERNYVFTVDEITQFSTGFYIFMDIDSMRELFGEDEDYYNVVFSDQELDIDSGRLYATTSKEDISKSSDVFVNMMMPMIYTMSVVSVLIFCVVMYLMMKMMIDRSAFGISLVKIFGYRSREIRKLYLDGNFYIVAVGAAVCLPLAKIVMDAMYPYLVSNVACGMNLTFSWQIYAGLYGGILALYFVINRLLIRRVNRLLPAEVLKNRE